LTQNDLSAAAKTYLSAIGASAIFVCVDKGAPVSVGVARDLEKALRHLQKVVSPTASLGWIAWGMNYGALAQLAQTPDLLYIDRGGLKTALPLPQLIGLIQLMAQESGVTLTAHHRALERAQVYSGYLDSALGAMQRNGTFAAFNEAYKQHRQDKRESVKPYWAVMQELRAVIIRALIADPKNRLSPDATISEIRKTFPWFTRPVQALKPRAKRKRH
jgi:ethanolamine utilization microcompartment shell protein EutS